MRDIVGENTFTAAKMRYMVETMECFLETLMSSPRTASDGNVSALVSALSSGLKRHMSL